MVPERPDGRFSLYLGTGGPGHLDPRQNDGHGGGEPGHPREPVLGGSALPTLRRGRGRRRRGPPRRSATASACSADGRGRRSPSLRSPEKGKSTGILENVLTPEARQHPWFRRFSEELPDGRRLRVVENRLFDLIPPDGGLPGFVRSPRLRDPGPRRTAGARRVTMLEFARDREGRHAPRLRREPPPRDRGPLPPGDDPRPEARQGRGQRTSGTRSGWRS